MGNYFAAAVLISSSEGLKGIRKSIEKNEIRPRKIE